MATHGASPASAPHAPQFRFRKANGVSPWMSADRLKDAARRGEIDPACHVQQAGHLDWVAANDVRGLFPPGTDRPADPPADPHAGSAAHHPTDAAGHGRHLRFATIRELLAAFLNAEVEVAAGEAVESRRLAAVGTDHVEFSADGDRVRDFVPYARIRRVRAFEESHAAALSYRGSHRLRIEVEAGD